jgi:hypothetical protein
MDILNADEAHQLDLFAALETVDFREVSIADISSGELVSVSFGLASSDNSWRLLSYIDVDTFSRLPLTDFQIDQYVDVLNWDIMSSKEIPARSIVKHADRINWEIFLRNKHKKELSALLDVKHKLAEHASVFFDNRMKKYYYNKEFMLIFPQYVDWNWCARYKKIDDYVLLKFWDKFKINILSRYQPMSDVVHQEKKYVINWKTASRWPIKEETLRQIINLVSIPLISRKQVLSESFIEEYITVLDIDKICRYQRLSESFILRKQKTLNMKIVSRYQYLSPEFIITNRHVLSMPDLACNIHYNKTNSLQVTSTIDTETNTQRWFIIDPTPMAKFAEINVLLNTSPLESVIESLD